jgi:hypothetical protein
VARTHLPQGTWRRRGGIGSLKISAPWAESFQFDLLQRRRGLHRRQFNMIATRTQIRFSSRERKTDASSGDEGTQLLLGHIPVPSSHQSNERPRRRARQRHDLRRASSPHQHPSVQAIEISPKFLKAAPLFGPANDNVFENSRFHLTIEDAKSFLQIHRLKSSISSSVNLPIPGWPASAGFLQLEYYETAGAHLAKRPHGSMGANL